MLFCGSMFQVMLVRVVLDYYVCSVVLGSCVVWVVSARTYRGKSSDGGNGGKGGGKGR